MSICTYEDGLFQVMVIDDETGDEIQLEGTMDLTSEEFDMVTKLFPPCVWTQYQQVLQDN